MGVSFGGLRRRRDPADLHGPRRRSEEHTSELQPRLHLVCRLLLEKKKTYANDGLGPKIKNFKHAMMSVRCFAFDIPAKVIRLFFFFNDTATTEIYTLSLHDALPIATRAAPRAAWPARPRSRRSATARRCAARSEEHTSELQSRLHLVCRLLLEKKKQDRKVRRTGAGRAVEPR